MKRFALLVMTIFLFAVLGTALAAEKKDPLAAWKPKFDPSGAQYTYVLSNISHPVIEGVGFGYRLRDRVWQDSGGRLYVDFRPLAQMGGGKGCHQQTQAGGRARHAEFFGGRRQRCRHPRHRQSALRRRYLRQA